MATAIIERNETMPIQMEFCLMAPPSKGSLYIYLAGEKIYTDGAMFFLMALDWSSIFRIFTALGFLCYASWQDVKTRTVSDAVWMAMGALGILSLIVEMVRDGSSVGQYMLLYPIALLFYDPYVDREPLHEKGKTCWPAVVAFFAAGIVVAISIYLDGFTKILVIPTMFLLVYLLYFSNVIHGGADAKALMAIALVIPWYPVLPSVPLIELSQSVQEVVDVTFPFVLLVLMMGSAMVLLLPLYNLAVNSASGDLEFPVCLFGRRMSVAKAKASMVWPMERVVQGRLVRTLFPRRGRDLAKEYEALDAAGIETLWVTPKIPFVVFLTVGLVLAAVLGNVVFWIGSLLA
jgi:preflagellin peptidase FlaK